MSRQDQVILISERVSYKASDDALQVIITGKVERWKESLLAVWVVVWILCGIVAMHEFYINPDREMRMVLFVFLAFWAYYLWRVGRVWLYRRGGNELIRISNGELIIKRSIYTYGKASTYFVGNVEELKPISLSKTSWTHTYENGWWVLGGEKLGFQYLGRYTRFAMQLNDAEVGKLYKLLRDRLGKEIKRKT